MKNNKAKRQLSLNITLIIAIISLVLVVALAAVFVDYKDSTNLIIDDLVQKNIDTKYEVGRVTHCYENNIKPCSDENLSLWNSSHPEEAMSLGSARLFN